MSTDVEFDVYPERLFDETWGSERWGYPIRAKRVGGRLYLSGQPGYDISQSVCLPRGELLEGLTDAEPFGGVDKELLVRLGLGVMVDAVLVPFHPSGLPEWTRLRAYLVELCGVAKENLPHLTCGDIMVILRREAGAHDAVPNMSGEARALAILTDHPDWPNWRIANEAGLHEKSLYKFKQFRRARKMLKDSGRAGLLRGFKTKDGDIEVYE